MIDPRGPRFAAGLTSIVLIVVLLTGSGWLMLAQAVIFGVSAMRIRMSPYGMIYRRFVAPHLDKPSELERAEPVRFAQFVGFLFAVVSAAGYLIGSPLTGAIAAGGALAAAFLNAAFGFCLGCEVYLAYRRTIRP